MPGRLSGQTLNGRGRRARHRRILTRGELDGTIRSAMGSRGVRVIEVRLPRDTMSPQRANMTAEMAKMRGAKAVEAAT